MKFTTLKKSAHDAYRHWGTLEKCKAKDHATRRPKATFWSLQSFFDVFSFFSLVFFFFGGGVVSLLFHVFFILLRRQKNWTTFTIQWEVVLITPYEHRHRMIETKIADQASRNAIVMNLLSLERIHVMFNCTVQHAAHKSVEGSTLWKYIGPINKHRWLITEDLHNGHDLWSDYLMTISGRISIVKLNTIIALRLQMTTVRTLLLLIPFNLCRTGGICVTGPFIET